MSNSEKIKKSMELLYSYGQVDGSHHKAWVIDQIAQILLGSSYEKFVHDYEYLDENGNESEEREYSWDTGIAP